MHELVKSIFGCPAELCCVQYGKAILHYSQLSKYPLREIHFVDKNLDIISHIQEAFAAMMPGERTSRLYKPVDVKKQTARDQNRRKDKGAIDGQKHKTLDIETAGPEIKNKAYPLTSNNRNQREKPLAQGYPYIHYEKPLGHYKETFTCHLGQGQVVYVYSTNLLTLQKIEMIACGDVPAGNGHGAVTKKLIEMGGKDYKKAKENAFRSKFVTNGSVVICNGGNNNFRFVAHAILTPWKKSDTEKERRKAVTSIFTEIFHGMKQCKCHSLALPLLGTGIGQGDPGYCAERLFQSLLMFCSKNKSYRFSINLVHMESEKTRIATEVIKRMVQGLVTDFEPVMPIRDRQKQKAGSDSKRGKPPGRPLSASQYPKSKPQMLVSGSKSYDSRRADKNYGTSNSTLSGFDKGRAKMQSPPRRMAPSINTNTSVPQGISDSDHSEDEEQSSYPKDPGTNDTHSCSSESSNENLPLGRLKIYEYYSMNMLGVVDDPVTTAKAWFLYSTIDNQTQLLSWLGNKKLEHVLF
ncbi:uncharacterized protein LOC128559632 [Mercenaria mercenaria]|uniref:uncharacterized protein LOC128559632 n=1 Tax=Mercenaria mercenaria TaxID=6596 RepID=UPI00234F534B|nr:uncharacterized protein LOC128559632 [Mercenaria mercenaria]